jgi:hypothetical protein
VSCMVIGIIFFALFSSPWVYLISAKYGKLTFNNAGTYNFMLIWRHMNLLETIGFTSPPDPIAVSVIDSLDRLVATSSFGGESTPVSARALAIVGRNLVRAVDIYQAGSLFSAAIILFAILSLTGLSRRKLFRNKIFLVLVTIALYTAGYLPLLVIKRYFYMNILLLFVLGISLLCRDDFSGRGRKQAAILCLCLSFMFMPIRDLYANAHVGRDIYRLSNVLGGMGVGGRIASNGCLDDSLFVSYHLRAKYYGIARPGIGDSELQREVARYGINYYLCWADKPCHESLSHYPEISDGRISQLRIYKVNE